jgi:hypothetical protein
MTKAELTAENGQAWERGQHCVVATGTQETHENRGAKILVMLLYVFSVVLRRPSLVHGAEIELGPSLLTGWNYVRKAPLMLFSARSGVTVDPAYPKRTIAEGQF